MTSNEKNYFNTSIKYSLTNKIHFLINLNKTNKNVFR